MVSIVAEWTMRIAYVANYQGPGLIAGRPIVRNLSMSNRVKMELVSMLLCQRNHEVVLVSPGEPGEARARIYPSFQELQRFHSSVSVDYASALPVRGITAAWSSASTVRLLQRRHRERPLDMVIIFNMKWPQLAAAFYAMRALRVPVVLEYEDDAFTSVHDEQGSPLSPAHRASCRKVLAVASGCIGVSPYLLSQIPEPTPRLLLRGVVGQDVIDAERGRGSVKLNRVVFAGTHIESNGVGPLIDAWKELNPPGWELHITGHGHLTDRLKAAAESAPSVVFHGLVERDQLVELLVSARVCINPHKVTEKGGVVFAFKIIEYLAAGAHVITTPMGALESSLECGITYMADNARSSIVSALRDVIVDKSYDRTAARAAQEIYGPTVVSEALDQLVRDAANEFRRRFGVG
jgi:glycosyltransferase involved in cell wall biosynthesis